MERGRERKKKKSHIVRSDQLISIEMIAKINTLASSHELNGQVSQARSQLLKDLGSISIPLSLPHRHRRP